MSATAAESTAAGRSTTATWVARRIGHRLRSAPLTLVLLAFLIAAHIVVQLLPEHTRQAIDTHLLMRLGALPRTPWTLLTSLYLPDGSLEGWAPRSLFATLGVLFLLGVPTERRLGTRRFAVALVAGHVMAAIGAAVFAWAVSPIFPSWSTMILEATFVGPGGGVLAAAACASCALAHLWRRRVQIGGLTVIVTMALYHGGALAVLALSASLSGLLLGRLLRLPRSEARPLGSIQEARVLIALIVAAAGVGPLVGSLAGFADGPFAVLGGLIARPDPEWASLAASGCQVDLGLRDCVTARLRGDPNPGILLLTCVPAILLMVCAVGLRRGRVLAWGMAIVIQTIMGAFFTATFVAELDASSDYAAATGIELTAADVAVMMLPVTSPLVVVALLILRAPLFRIRGAKGSVRRLLERSALTFAAGLTVYVLGGLAVAEQWTDAASAAQLAVDAPRRLVPLEYLLPVSDAFPALLPTGPGATALYSWVGILTWAPVVVALVIALAHAPAADTSAGQARSLLIRYGGGSLSWMALWDGNRHWFSGDGQSFVAYRVINGIAVTTGDLIGPVDSRDAALTEFLSFVDTQGWGVCFYSATEDLRARTTARGWESTRVAEEAVLLLPGLAFTGKKFQDVRTALNHVKRDGFVTSWTTWREAPLGVRLQIREISEQWVGEQALPEMRFTLGGLAELADPDVRLFLLADPDGVLHGCASWLPIHRDGRLVGWTLDFMRRRPDGFRHTMEVLIGQAALDLKAEGFEELSLSGAPLAKVAPGAEGGEGADRRTGVPAAVDAVLDRVGQQLEPVYGFRSLLRFKAKFQPVYRPLYLLFPDPAALPGIGTAIARAYLPDASLTQLLRTGGQLRDTLRRADRQERLDRAERERAAAAKAAEAAAAKAVKAAEAAEVAAAKAVEAAEAGASAKSRGDGPDPSAAGALGPGTDGAEAAGAPDTPMEHDPR